MQIQYCLNLCRVGEKENATSNSRQQVMKESVSMGQIQSTGNYPDAVPAKVLSGLNIGAKGKNTKNTPLEASVPLY